MLIPLKKLEPEKQAECLRNGWIALDPKTGATLRRSPEEVQPSSQVKYYLYIPNIMVRVIWAKTDKEALAIANNGGSRR
jgi:hypothetical protein